MKLEFLYLPAKDLKAALALYRDGMGWEEAWREGDTTVALVVPGSEVQVMVDTAGSGGVGPLFVVDSVAAFHESRPSGLEVVEEPSEIPGGYMVTYADPSGNPIYVMDQSTDTGAAEAG